MGYHNQKYRVLPCTNDPPPKLNKQVQQDATAQLQKALDQLAFLGVRLPDTQPKRHAPNPDQGRLPSSCGQRLDADDLRYMAMSRQMQNKYGK